TSPKDLFSKPYLVGFADEDDWIDYLMLRDPKFRDRLQRSLQFANATPFWIYARGVLLLRYTYPLLTSAVEVGDLST
ncbi:MAG TPA: hypothetical protein DEA78_26045, partial [Cyanobacteria bacterium UBA11159]|nr:hypothetical protein [Cyanobacteria bacterium UBA11159]